MDEGPGLYKLIKYLRNFSSGNLSVFITNNRESTREI